MKKTTIKKEQLAAFINALSVALLHGNDFVVTLDENGDPVNPPAPPIPPAYV